MRSKDKGDVGYLVLNGDGRVMVGLLKRPRMAKTAL